MTHLLDLLLTDQTARAAHTGIPTHQPLPISAHASIRPSRLNAGDPRRRSPLDGDQGELQKVDGRRRGHLDFIERMRGLGREGRDEDVLT